MRSVWRGLAGVLFWSYERGTWRYDLAVAAILLFVLLTPRGWFRDHPQTGPPARAANIVLLESDAQRRLRTYRVDAHLLARPRITPELEREIHDLLRKQVPELRDRRFQVERIESVAGEGGVVLYYVVSVK